MNRETFKQQIKQRQTFATAKAQLKVKRHTFSEDGVERTVTTLSGYPILWSPETSSDRGGYVVRIAPGAANFASNTFALYHHDFKDVLGATSNGTLRIGEPDEIGVPIEIDLNMDTTLGRDVYAMVSRGDVAGMSFSMANGFEDYTESTDPSGQAVITCTKFTADEVTITPIPAFANTTIGVAGDEDETPHGGMAAVEPRPVSMSDRAAASTKLLKYRLDRVSL